LVRAAPLRSVDGPALNDQRANQGITLKARAALGRSGGVAQVVEQRTSYSYSRPLATFLSDKALISIGLAWSRNTKSDVKLTATARSFHLPCR
jgi:hypothetical protein